MYSCERIDPKDFHSRSQRDFTVQSVAMLQRSKDYQGFWDAEDQTTYMQTVCWFGGILFLAFQCWMDYLVTHGSSTKDSFEPGIAVNAIFPRYMFVVVPLLVLFPIGSCLLAPWAGCPGTVAEEASLIHLIVVHIAAAVVISMQPLWRPADVHRLALFETDPLTLSPENIQTVGRHLIPALMPVVCGILFETQHRKFWKHRIILTSPIITLAPLFSIVSFGLWIYAAGALRATDSVISFVPEMIKLITQDAYSLVEFVLANPITVAPRAIAAVRSSNVMLSTLYTEATIYAAAILVSSVVCGLLSMLIVPLISAIVRPQFRILWFVYVVAIVWHVATSMTGSTPVAYIVVPVLYLVFLFFNIPEGDQ